MVRRLLFPAIGTVIISSSFLLTLSLGSGTAYAATKGWQQIDDNWYYYDKSGKPVTGWIKVSSKWYYMNSDGIMQTGWLKLGKKKYYLKKSGAMVTGWKTIKNERYHFKSSGALDKNCWLEDGLQWYYAGKDGKMLKGASYELDGKKYKFDAKGRWIDPTQKKLMKTETAKISDQIVLVVGHKLTVWEKDEDGLWYKTLDVYCGYGRNGFKLPEVRKAGDKTTPIGSFPLTLAFGTTSGKDFPMTYRKITKYSYWSSEKGKTYNTWVESKTKIKGEHLKDYYQYKYAMAVGFNMDPAVYGRGSAIFLHCKSNNTWSTAGCVSVKEKDMLYMMKNLKDGAYILIVPDSKGIADY